MMSLYDTNGNLIDFVYIDSAGNYQFQVNISSGNYYLVAIGRDDLAKKVNWVSQTIGDGLGFDVLSFDEGNDSERLIEVKTTGLGKFFPFYVTGNEVRCSEDMKDQFHLFRVFDFARKPRVYILRGPLTEKCHLEPTQYRATI